MHYLLLYFLHKWCLLVFFYLFDHWFFVQSEIMYVRYGLETIQMAHNSYIWLWIIKIWLQKLSINMECSLFMQEMIKIWK